MTAACRMPSIIDSSKRRGTYLTIAMPHYDIIGNIKIRSTKTKCFMRSLYLKKGKGTRYQVLLYLDTVHGSYLIPINQDIIRIMYIRQLIHKANDSPALHPKDSISLNSRIFASKEYYDDKKIAIELQKEISHSRTKIYKKYHQEPKQ